MNFYETTGIICLNKNNLIYHLAKIKYTLFEDDSFKYELFPNYNVINLLDDFQGIPGFNLELNKEVYLRENKIPIFISERAPNKNREDLWDLLESVNLDYLNQLEWLIRTKTQYSGDNLYVIENKEINTNIDSFDLLGNNSSLIIKEILNLICSGKNFNIKENFIDDSNRSIFYNILLELYLKNLNYRKQQQVIGLVKKGRPQIRLSILEEEEIFTSYFKNKISLEDALKKLKISQASFYRKYKIFKNKII